jgi:hypothetical protein
MKFTTQTLVAILATTATAQSVDFASLTGAAASRVSSYMAHVTAEPEYASVSSVAATAVKTKWQQSFLSGDLSKVSTKSWYAGLPSDIRSFAASVQSEVLKIATSDGSAATSGSATSAASASVSKTAVNAATTSAASASKSSSSSSSASASASKASSSAAASATKNGAVETGVGKMMGVAAVGAIGALML